MPRSKLTRRRFVADVVFVVWIVIWGGVAVAIYDAVDDLRQITVTLERGAGALDETADGLRSVSGVPFVGDDIEAIADEVSATADETRTSAAGTADVIDRVAVLIALAVFVAGVVPVAVAYVPRRVRRAQEVRAARRAAAARAGADGRSAEEYLAARALVGLSFDELRRTSNQPLSDAVQGRTGPLADAELRRVGVRSS